MIKTVLFDLDGTLSTMEEKDFSSNYLKLLAPKFNPFIEPEQVIKQIITSTEVMKNNLDVNVTNMQAFMNDFNQSLGLAEFITWPIFMEFYQYTFPELKDLAKPEPGGREAVEAALEKGLDISIASNAVLPRIAMQERLRWAAIDHLPVSYLPSIEEMHFCKPQIEFFQELLEKTGRKPEDCLMVGDDPMEDMIAGKLGIKTFLIERGDPQASLPFKPDYRGTLEDVKELIISL
ncbi:MAG: HAD family hydrolase [Clostridia bacterium]|nr:HAD family hydrolase [Clostridia bacterium]